jgi:hypothetical protein
MLLVSACGTSDAHPAAPQSTVPTATAAPSLTTAATSTSVEVSVPTSDTVAADPWAADLAVLDAQVRAHHPNPFAIHSEAEWVAKLAELKRSLPNATDDERIVQLASLIALLDTHSSFDGLTKPDAPLAFRFYQLQLYGFSEGWFVVRAKDPTIVGLQLVSIGGVPAADVVTRMSALLPADNPSGKLDGLGNWLTAVEYLHGLGIVKDPAAPQFVFKQPTGQQITVNPGVSPDEGAWENDIDLAAPPPGKAPEAIVRHGEALWTRLDAATHTFLVSYNDYGDTSAAIAAMKAALDGKQASRVVLDMRYLQGGNARLADPLIAALTNDPRVNQAGKLVVLIGRQNESAGTVVAAKLDHGTQATLVGEPTPAKADNFLCACTEILLPHSGYTVQIPTTTSHNGDTRDAVTPDVPIAPSAVAYFAGADPVLQAALLGKL